jgi:hypothetical protein
MRRNRLISGRSLLCYREERQTNWLWVITAIHFTQNFIQHPSTEVKSIYTNVYMKLLGIISVGFDVTDQQLIRFFALNRYWRKDGNMR